MSTRKRWIPAAGALLAAFALAVPSQGQSMMMPTQVTDAQVFWFLQNLPPESARPLGSLVNALLSDTAGHMKMAERRTASAKDRARADSIVRTMRSSLGQYADVAVAERDGYVLFLPWLKEQSIYHYNNMSNAGAARTGFDVARPSSLLYRADRSGKRVLVGAMYTAPATSTPDELDARLPLGVAHWHQHVNFCAMNPGVAVASLQQGDSTVFARWLAIETPDACAKAGGLFIPQLFGWMAHVNAFDGDSRTEIWGAEGRDHMHMHSH